MAVQDIYSGNALVQPKSVQDFDNENLLMQAKRQQLQQGSLAMQQTQAALQQQQNAIAQQQGLRDALGTGKYDLSNPQHQAQLASQFPDAAPKFLDTVQQGLLRNAQTGEASSKGVEAQAKASSSQLDDKIKSTEFLVRSMPTDGQPASLAQWYKSGIDRGFISQDRASAEFAAIPFGDPQAMAQWASQQQAQGVAQAERYKQQQENARSTATNTTSAANNAATNQAHLQATNITQGGENQRAALQRATQLKINGMDQNGNFVGLGPTPAADPNAPAGAAPPSPLAAMVDAIGQYKQPAAIVLSRMAPGLKDQVLAQVQAKYPDYDGTQFGARIQAAKAYSAGGKETAGIQAANTALNHLDTIQQLAAAQKNGNYPLFNQIANQIGAQTGQAPPTNLRAAISMVAPELTKAVVGTGGGVAERADFAHNLNPNGSPDQILGGVATIQELMGGRLGEVARTYERTTGKKDFNTTMLSPAAQRVLASRAGSNAAASVPDDIAAILQKHGAK